MAEGSTQDIEVLAPSSTSTVIEAVGLTKFYGKARGIIAIDLGVKQGDIFGFIGPNGAGKSTFIRILLGLISATAGSARILGFDCARQNRDVLAQVGYMPSEVMFYHGMKVKDLLKLSANLRKQDCSREAALLCDRLDLDQNRKVNELSIGNRRKVQIVCALQHKPPLYILDEPTSGLDPLVQKEFFSLLMERNQEGATILLSSHILSEVQRYCKNAAIIREGRIIASGTVEALSSSSARHVHIQGISEPPHLAGIRNLNVLHDGLDFLYQGDMRLLVKTLAGLDFSDLFIEEPDIEEVFMHYYEAAEPELPTPENTANHAAPGPHNTFGEGEEVQS